jgi:hypothetical protein
MGTTKSSDAGKKTGVTNVPMRGPKVTLEGEAKGGSKDPVEDSSPGAGVPAGGKLASTNRVTTPIKVEELRTMLSGYNEQKVTYLLDGFHHGFKLGHTGERKELHSKNLKSARENPSLVQDKINKELKAGRLAGPFTEAPFDDFCSSPIGLVPKNKRENSG